MKGISDPYKPPEQPEVVVRTHNESQMRATHRELLEKRECLT